MVDPVLDLFLCRSGPPKGHVCLNCFGPPSNEYMGEEAHSWLSPLLSNEDDVARPSNFV